VKNHSGRSAITVEINKKERKYMRRLFLLVPVILIIASLLLASCAQPAPAPTPKPSPAPAPAPKQTITLKWGHYSAPTDVRFKDLNFYVDRVRELTNGGLELKIYPSEQLVKTNEELEATMRGSIDMASLNPDYFVGKARPLHFYSEVIYTAPGYLTEAIFQTRDLLTTFFETLGLEYVTGVELQPIGLAVKKKLVKLPEDVKGLKLRAPGNLTAIVQAWGGSPASIPNPEVYMAMQQGVVDGALTGYGTMLTQKHWEVTDYATALSVTPGSLITVVNLNTWKSLPDAYKQAMLKAAEEAVPVGKKNAADFVDTYIKTVLPNFKQSYVVPPGSPEADKWWGPVAGQSAAVAIKEMGPAGQQWWDKIVKIVDGLKAQKK
jgi:TRAP-type C4-dicarboxylate transport system substrate-binding protein